MKFQGEKMEPETLINQIGDIVTAAITAALANSGSAANPTLSSSTTPAPRSAVRPRAGPSPSISAVATDSEDEFEREVQYRIPYDKLGVIQTMVHLKLPITEISKRLNVSRPTVYTILKKNHITTNKYSNITDNELDGIVSSIKGHHPAAGQIIVQGHLRARNIHIQRHRLRQSLLRTDRDGVQLRKIHTIRRRTYFVPGPNFIWHIDGTHKLIRWRFVIHAAIDGFSRLLTFAQCSNNNRAATVVNLFDKACEKYGYPLRVRTDEGGENVDVWNRMYQLFDEQSNPVIVGSSVHNQRIERMHRDVNEQVVNKYYNVFYQMEQDGFLNPENTTDLYCLHYVYIPIINKHLHEFVLAHNNHNISTEHNSTPLQLFLLNYKIRENRREADQDFQGGLSASALDTANLPYVNVEAIVSPLNEEEHAELERSINPLTYIDPVVAFRDVVIFVARHV